MKNYKLPVLGFALMILVAACKKEDVQIKDASKIASAVSTASQWQSFSNWSSSKNDNATTYSSKVVDSTITANVAGAGVVLVFKKTGKDIQSLPFQEKENKTYWYYQVSKGSVQINSDNNSVQNLKEQSFSYFVITPEKLSSLEASGKTKMDLLQLTYDQAVSLLK
jgi:hypothetical protein